jgi:hypothetical protein
MMLPGHVQPLVSAELLRQFVDRAFDEPEKVT